MKLAEFTCCWDYNYTEDDEKNYTIMLGPDRSGWPKTNDKTPVTLDLDRVCRFNPHHNDRRTTVEIAGGYSYQLLITYVDFKRLMIDNGYPITRMINTTENAVQD